MQKYPTITNFRDLSNIEFQIRKKNWQSKFGCSIIITCHSTLE